MGSLVEGEGENNYERSNHVPKIDIPINAEPINEVAINMHGTVQYHTQKNEATNGHLQTSAAEITFNM